jgi:hypothetical protein
MVRWELTKFKIKQSNEGIFNSVLNFEAEIIVPETRKNFVAIYDGKQFIIGGSQIRQNYLPYDIKSGLDSILSSTMITELSKHSRKAEYLRSFSLTKISAYPEGTLANLRYEYNDKFLEICNVLVIPPYKDPNKLCQVPLTIETNAVSSVKSFFELINKICTSAIRIYIDINKVNEIIRVILQKIGI